MGRKSYEIRWSDFVKLIPEGLNDYERRDFIEGLNAARKYAKQAYMLGTTRQHYYNAFNAAWKLIRSKVDAYIKKDELN